jgi:hypothetical protein
MNRPHPLGWPNALHPRETPCRVDPTKVRRQHPCSPAHRALVDGYRAWRDGEYDRAEAADAGDAHTPRNDPGTYWTTAARPTFRAYLAALDS